MRILNTNNARSGERGGALVFALLVLTSLMMLSVAFYVVSTRSRSELTASVDDRRAYYAAEAGLAEGMAALRAGNTGNVGSQATPAYLAGGMFWVEATDLGDQRTRLQATALIGQGRVALETVVEDTTQDPIFSAVLNSREQLTVNADVMIDSYDSSVGDYASQAVNTTNGHTHANMNGDVTSNEDIVVNANADVFGDATPGTDNSVVLSMGSYVSGSTAPAPADFAFPPIDVPSVPPSGTMTVPNGGSGVLAAGSYGFDDLTISRDGTLLIEGPTTIVVGNFTGGKDASLQIDATNGPVTIIVETSYTHTSGFEASAVVGSPMALAFMIAATQDIVFPSQTRVRGGYYAPNSNITFANYCEAWGSFAGNQVNMSSSMQFHYDEHLSEYWNTSSGGEDPWDVLLHRTIAVTPSSLLRDRRDPFVLLGLDRGALPSPGAAWDI